MSRRGDEGSATAEMVLTTPALLTLLLLTVQLGLWFHASHVVHAAAQEAARASRVEGGTSADGEARAGDLLDSLAPRLLTDRHVTVTRTAEVARVEVTGHVTPVLPGVRLPVRAVSQGPVERFRAVDEPLATAPPDP